MDESISDRLLDDPGFFAPAADHRVVEIQASSDSPQPKLREYVLAERQLSTWAREAPVAPSTDFSFRLLICSPRIAERDIWPLPVSSDSAREILRTLEAPPLFFRAICRQIPLAACFESFDSSSSNHGMILRTNLSHVWQYALALIHNPATNSTTAVVFGLRGSEIKEVLETVRRSAMHLSCPSVLPCILMDKALDALAHDAEERRQGLTQIRFETGSHGFTKPNLERDFSDTGNDLDLDFMMQKLTSLSDACAGIGAVSKMQHTFLSVISEFQARFDPGFTKIGSRHTRQQLRFLEQILGGVESKITYTKSSVQDQVQTIYTLINQRESRSHMMLAKTTRRLAELSRQDSTAMRVISAVTLVFLPATFTSTFFSASFFNFTPEESNHVSAWIWLYCTITAGLTLIVLASWWFFSHRENARALAASRKESNLQHEALKNFRLDWDRIEPIRKIETFRPYLGGSVVDGVFAREVNIPSGIRTVETSNLSPTATSSQKEFP